MPRPCANPACHGTVGDWITESALCTSCFMRGVPEPTRSTDRPLNTFGDEERDDEETIDKELDFH